MIREKTQAGLPWTLPLQKEEFIPDGDLDTDWKVWFVLVYWCLMALSTQTLSVMRMTSIERFTTCTLELCYFVNLISALLG